MLKWPAAALLAILMVSPSTAAPVESFQSFVRNFEARALAAGVTRETYDSAMDGLTPDPDIPDYVATQPEFTTTMWDYIDKRVTKSRVARGRVALEALLSEGKLPSRREHDNHDKTALQAIMSDVDTLSRDRLPKPDEVEEDED